MGCLASTPEDSNLLKPRHGPRIVMINMYQPCSIESCLSHDSRLTALENLSTKLQNKFQGVTIAMGDLYVHERDRFRQLVHEGDVLLLFPSGNFTNDRVIRNLLPYAHQKMGKDKVAVLIGERNNPLALFPYLRNQPEIGEYADLVLFCACVSHISRGAQWNSLCGFLEKALNRSFCQ